MNPADTPFSAPCPPDMLLLSMNPRATTSAARGVITVDNMDDGRNSLGH